MAGNDDFDQRDVQRLLSGGAVGMTADVPPMDHEKNARTLAALALKYMEDKPDFETGNTIRQREGLGINSKAQQHLPYTFVRYLEDAQVVYAKFPMYFKLDCIVGQLDHEGDIQFILADSRRWEIYPPEALAEIGLAARKQVN